MKPRRTLPRNIIAAEEPRTCSVCHEERETRPYGKDGAEICFPCGMLPEHRPYVDAAMSTRFGSKVDPS